MFATASNIIIMYARCVQQQSANQTHNDNYNSGKDKKKRNDFMEERDENIFRPVNAVHSMRLHTFIHNHWVWIERIVRFFKFFFIKSSLPLLVLLLLLLALSSSSSYAIFLSLWSKMQRRKWRENTPMVSVVLKPSQRWSSRASFNEMAATNQWIFNVLESH